MNENETNNQYKLQFIDKFLISMLGIMSLLVTIITIVAVNIKYERLHAEKLKELNPIPYNETYKYLSKENNIKFYKDIKDVSEYKCIKDCKITKFSSNQFIIDNDDLIPIRDNNNVIYYSISKNTNALTLDDIPHTSINNKYGTIQINNKYGVINKHGTVILNCIYDDVDINVSHIVTLYNKVMYVFDNDAKRIARKRILETGDISISEKTNHLYINVIGNKTSTYIFDTNRNRFIN